MKIFKWVSSLFSSKSNDYNEYSDITDVYYEHKYPKIPNEEKYSMAELRVEERDEVNTSQIEVGGVTMSGEDAAKLIQNNPRADNFHIPGQVKPGQQKPQQQQQQQQQHQHQQSRPPVSHPHTQQTTGFNNADPSQYMQQPMQQQYQVPVNQLMQQQGTMNRSNEELDYFVVETTKAYGVSVSLPGLTKSELDIGFKSNTINISASLPDMEKLAFDKAKPNKNSSKAKFMINMSSNFTHKKNSKFLFKFTKPVDANAIEATMENSILVLKLPIIVPPETDNIEINIL